MSLRFRTTVDSDSDLLMIGPKQHNGEFAWFPVIHVRYMNDHADFDFKYIVSVKAVSIEALTKQGNMDSVESSWGMMDDFVWSEDKRIYAICEYGSFAPIHEETGNNLRNLLTAARKEATLVCVLTGFYFDRAINGIGNTGWDAILGETGWQPRPLYLDADDYKPMVDPAF